MNHGERVKDLAEELVQVCDEPEDLQPYNTKRAELHTAIDAMQSALDDAVAKLAARDAEVERLRKDAERYRFIRDADRSDCITPELALYALETLDEYVDAAMEDEVRLNAAAAEEVKDD